MKAVSLFTGILCVVPFVFGANREDVINQMVMDIDANGDGIVTESELHSEFVVLMDRNQDWMITQDEFLNAETGWPSFYGESQETSAAFFDNLDVACIKRIRSRFMSGCGRIGPMDLIAIYESMEKDGDYKITTEQLKAKMEELYP